MFAPYLCREIQCFSHRSSGGKWRRKLQSSPSKVFSSSTFNFCKSYVFQGFLIIHFLFFSSKVLSSFNFYFQTKFPFAKCIWYMHKCIIAATTCNIMQHVASFSQIFPSWIFWLPKQIDALANVSLQHNVKKCSFNNNALQCCFNDTFGTLQFNVSLRKFFVKTPKSVICKDTFGKLQFWQMYQCNNSLWLFCLNINPLQQLFLIPHL